MILEHPDPPAFIRAVVATQVHNVFGDRSRPAQGIGPVGARLAIAYESGSSAPDHDHSVSTAVAFPTMRKGSTVDATRDGRATFTVFRACGVEREAASEVERIGVLQCMRLTVDFEPEAHSEGGGRRLRGGDDPWKLDDCDACRESQSTKPCPESEVPEAALALRFVSQALTTAAARWSGTERADSRAVLSVVRPCAEPSVPELWNPDPFVFEIGTPVAARGRFVTLFLRGSPERLGQNNVEVRLFRNVRASMPSTETSTEWDLHDLEVQAIHTTAHELGHALGLPDEYVESQMHATGHRSCKSISDEWRSPGAPYQFDEWSMMKGNVVPRARHVWPLALALVGKYGVFKGEPISLVHGKRRYRLPVTEQENNPAYFPVAMTPDPKGVPVGEVGLCDAYMYLLGLDAFADAVLFGSSEEHPYDALVVAELKVAMSFENRSFRNVFGLMKVVGRFPQRLPRIEAVCTLDGRKLRTRLVVSPRFIVRSCPSLPQTAVEADALHEYLRNLSYKDLVLASARDRTATQFRDDLPTIMSTIEDEYESLVQRMIDDWGVHAHIRVVESGKTHLLEEATVPRRATLRLRRWDGAGDVEDDDEWDAEEQSGIDELDEEVVLSSVKWPIYKVLGSLLGLRRPTGITRAEEYRPIFAALQATSGKLEIGDIRRVR
jgi:hypothetical protein